MMVDQEYIRNLEKTKFCGFCGGKIRVTDYPLFKCQGCGVIDNINFFWNDDDVERLKNGTMYVSPKSQCRYVFETLLGEKLSEKDEDSIPFIQLNGKYIADPDGIRVTKLDRFNKEQPLDSAKKTKYINKRLIEAWF